MTSNPWLDALVGFVSTFLFGTFVEYVVHRLMHKRIFLGKVHTEHHKDGNGQGWLKEFRDYVLPTLPLFIVIFAGEWLLFGLLWMAIGSVAGGLFYAMFAAYAHQIQHEYPELACWMRMPVHHVHHANHQWFHNFGIATDVWDHVFRTYKKTEWKPERPVTIKRFFQIKWI